MDEFGVLTERYGLKSQKKSAPMAASKRESTTTVTSNDTQIRNSNLNPKPTWNSNSVSGSFVDNQDFLFPSKKTDVYGDVFGDFQKGSNGFDYDSVFASSGSMSSPSMNLYDDGDIFGLKSSNPGKDDIFGSFSASSGDDLLGGFGVKSNNSSQNGSVKTGFDDLIPGFGASSPDNGEKVKTAKLSFTAIEDPFIVLESTSTVANTSFTDPLEEISKLSGGKKPGSSSTVTPPLIPPPKPAQVLKADKVKSSSVSPIDELEEFAMGGVRNNADAHLKEGQSTKASRYKEAEDAALESQQKGEDYLQSIFDRSNSEPSSRATTLDLAFGAKIHCTRGPQVANTTTSGASYSVKKASPATNMVNDLSSIFGDASLFGEFDEVEGESKERRIARLGRHQRTQDRVAQAVADMNQRDRQTQHEQEERRRIADTLDFEIKRWAAGKEGNMRALLSSLQQVLWPECGWEPVSLTDLITSSSVKKVYRKSTLYVHPDKVQQKGATLQQQYIAEKVFDILKEAWIKFKSEELS